ncbi:MAG: zinc-binding dehydrogenase, partial [Bacteroidota bacterium]
LELSGVVEKVGKDVTSLKQGDRVFALTRQGAYAEYVCLPAAHTEIVPENMSFEEAAALSVTYLSAYHGLITLAHIQKGEKLLLHAAAGGVGTAAIQISKHLGAEVFAAAGTKEKLAVARRQGADYLINYRTEDFSKIIRSQTKGYGVDVVMDSVGGSVFRKGWKLLAPMGRYVLYGLAAVTGERKIKKLAALREIASMSWIFPPSIVSKNVSLMGFNLYFLAHKVDYFRNVAKEILEWYRTGIIRPVVGSIFPFEQITEAQAFLQSRKSYGKVLVVL